jgi:hypothetical protein
LKVSSDSPRFGAMAILFAREYIFLPIFAI